MKNLFKTLAFTLIVSNVFGQGVTIEPNILRFNPVLYFMPFNNTDPSLRLISTHSTFKPNLSLRHYNNFIGAITGNNSNGFLFYTNQDYQFQTNINFNYLTALKIQSNGNVGIGTETASTKLEVNGFTKLGADAPAIKTIKITTTTAAAQGVQTTIPHGLTASKILGIQAMVKQNIVDFIPPSHDATAGTWYDIKISGNDIIIFNKAGSSSSILSKAISILITYEE